MIVFFSELVGLRLAMNISTSRELVDYSTLYSDVWRTNNWAAHAVAALLGSEEGRLGSGSEGSFFYTIVVRETTQSSRQL